MYTYYVCLCCIHVCIYVKNICIYIYTNQIYAGVCVRGHPASWCSGAAGLAEPGTQAFLQPHLREGHSIILIRFLFVGLGPATVRRETLKSWQGSRTEEESSYERLNRSSISKFSAPGLPTTPDFSLFGPTYLAPRTGALSTGCGPPAPSHAPRKLR